MVPLNQMHGFLLHSSTGHRPAGTEIDVPIVYADYYFFGSTDPEKEFGRMTFVKVDLAAKDLFFLAANFKIHLNFFVCWTLVVKCCPAHKLMKNL